VSRSRPVGSRALARAALAGALASLLGASAPSIAARASTRRGEQARPTAAAPTPLRRSGQTEGRSKPSPSSGSSQSSAGASSGSSTPTTPGARKPVRGRALAGRGGASGGESSSGGGARRQRGSRGRAGASGRETGGRRGARSESSLAQATPEVEPELQTVTAQSKRVHHKRPPRSGGSRGRGRGVQGESGGSGTQGAGSSESAGKPRGSTAAGVVLAAAATAPLASVGLDVSPRIEGIAVRTAGPATKAASTGAARAKRTPRRSTGAGHALTGLGPVAAAGPIAAAVVAAPVIHTTAERRAAGRPSSTSRPSSNPLQTIGKQIPLPVPVPDWSKPIIIVLLLLAGWFGVRSLVVARRARRLERQHVGLLRDMGAMQAALVPEVPEHLQGLRASVAYRPAEGPAAGGDFYDLFTPAPGKVAIMLGDVAGHGHEALTHAALTRYTLRAYLQAGLEPRMALGLAGRVLVDPTGERYATVAVGALDTRSGRLTYALAGHPPPILLGGGEFEPVTVCSSPPIGWGMPTGRRQTTVSLPVGAEACFFSDGLIEARCDGELLGRGRLGAILAGLGPEPQAARLLAQVRAAAQGAPDDMIACIVSPQPIAHGGPVRVEELEVDQFTLAAVKVRRFLAECLLPDCEIEQTLEYAREIAASFGTALLRVEIDPTATTAAAIVPSSRRSRGAARRRSVDEPLIEALAG
jgi:Stage II sporulation protein E (SpoIIE)